MFNPAITVEMLNGQAKANMPTFLGIEFTEIGDNYVCAKMPVDERTRQPFGILHGGASVVLAETLGSTGAWLASDPTQVRCVGLEINANHISSVKEGFVWGKATAVHVGRATQVWEIRITDDNGKLVCISRITMAVVPHK
ncbi:MAG TPA: thioesterase [Microscillaceae bacterium]|jgi:1,4-dihydroxy-2-naphthoyl-CoA hydrolase|nr:thioesterase [Microscillaceae bacterium]